MNELQNLAKRVEELEKAEVRHTKVIEKLIDTVAKLEIANNIQNVINQANYAGNQDDKKDISDSSLRP